MVASCRIKFDTESPYCSLLQCQNSDGISKETVDISEDDAITIAILQYKKMKTKSYCSITSVVPFKDNSGNTLLYAVNCDEGCILISATKKYYPILAIIEDGTIIDGHTNTGADVFIQNYLNEISLTLTDEDAPILHDDWYQFGEGCFAANGLFMYTTSA